MTIDELLTIAATVRDATTDGENTAERVGGLLVEMCNFLKTADLSSVQTLYEAISNEATYREKQDATLSEQISSEATARDTKIGEEAAFREQQDATLSTQISNETTARKEADTTLQTAIDKINSTGSNTNYVTNVAVTQTAAHPTFVRFTIQKGGSVQYSADIANATTSVQGLMSAADKTSLDALTGGTDSHYLTALAVTQTRPYYVDITPSFGGTEGSKISIGAATESAAGVMTAGDKAKLNAYPAWETLNARIAALEG